MKRTSLIAMAMITILAGTHLSDAAEEKAKKKEPLPKTIGKIIRLDPAFDRLVPKDAKIEVLAGGFEWSEGPEWVGRGGYLLFSDIPNNVINQWSPKKGISTYLKPSGYTGKKPFKGFEPGTNGLLLDDQGRLLMCCHGDRQVVRLEEDGSRTVLAAKYNGKRLNSPNDLVLHSSGDLYFTDPPYGLPKRWEDPGRELDFCGVYRLSAKGGQLSPKSKLTLLTKEMTRPNGIALSPDEKTLYVAQSDPKAAIIKRFPVKKDGTLGKGELFFDASSWAGKRPGLPDGMAVDVLGNVWATAPGGVYLLSPQGKLLGRLATGERTANCTFGDDGSTLYITADMYLCRVRTKTKGVDFK